MEIILSVPLLIMAGISDWKKRIIPNKIIVALLSLGSIEIILDILNLINFQVSIGERTIGMIIPFIVLFFIYVLKKKLIGGGDIKLLSSLGLCIGIYNLYLILIITCIGGVLHCLIKKEKYIPLGFYVMISSIILFFTQFIF